MTTGFGRALARLHRLGHARTADVQGDYTGASTAPGIDLHFDSSYVVYDENGLAQRVTAISVLVVDVPESRQGDRIALPGRTWEVQQILEDDGHVRRLYVS